MHHRASGRPCEGAYNCSEHGWVLDVIVNLRVPNTFIRGVYTLLESALWRNICTCAACLRSSNGWFDCIVWNGTRVVRNSSRFPYLHNSTYILCSAADRAGESE